MDIGKGDFVECVEGYRKKGILLVARNLYCVEAVSRKVVDCSLHRDSGGCSGVRTTDPILPKGRWWCSNRFRPILKFKKGQFDYLMANLDEPASEDV